MESRTTNIPVVDYSILVMSAINYESHMSISFAYVFKILI